MRLRSNKAGQAAGQPLLSPALALALLVGLTVLTFAASDPSLARESDLTQGIDVSADRSEYNEREGTQTLIGNVEISQGSMRIEAELVTIKLTEFKLTRIEGEGSPIRFQQENEAGELISGEASNISYDATTGELVLSGGASLSQPGQSLQSERIAFDARTQTVSAEGGENKGRVSIRIEPPGKSGDE